MEEPTKPPSVSDEDIDNLIADVGKEPSDASRKRLKETLTGKEAEASDSPTLDKD